MKKEDTSVGAKLRSQHKERKKKERFIRCRMWFSTFMSIISNDRGTIPPNIGNNILITNNMYVTKNSLSAVITIAEFSNVTNLAWTSDLLQTVKDKQPNVTIDYTFKNKRAYYNMRDNGLQARISTWEATLKNPFADAKHAERSARLLHAVDVIGEGVKTYHSYIYITVRAKTGTELSAAIDACCNYLDSMHAIYKVIKSDLENHLEYMSIISDKSSKAMKNVAYTLQTAETLAESLPITQGMNDVEGNFLGLNKRNFAPYYIDFMKSSNAKNMYIDATSGFGKTFMVITWLIDWFACNIGMLIMDIKGNEFTAFTRAVGGIVLSMRFDSPIYVNVFVWRKSSVKNNGYNAYTNKMLNLAKQMLMIMCNFQDVDTRDTAETFIESFLLSMYVSIGTTPENPNTWKSTEQLNPFVVYEYLERYTSFEIRQKYGKVAQKVLDRLRIFMTKTGSCSHMLRQPVVYEDILDTKVLTFDFGILSSSQHVDPVAFELKFFFMRLINDEFGAYRKEKGPWTAEILEESEIVSDNVMQMYTQAMTLGRAQNKINVMLGNSIAAIANNPVAAPILGNINIFVFGVLNKPSRNYVADTFDLSDDDLDDLEKIAKGNEYQHTFLLVNKMQKNATTALLQAYVPPDVVNSKVFKVVDTTDDNK